MEEFGKNKEGSGLGTQTTSCSLSINLRKKILIYVIFINFLINYSIPTYKAYL